MPNRSRKGSQPLRRLSLLMRIGVESGVCNLGEPSPELKEISIKAPPSELTDIKIPRACRLRKFVKIPKVSSYCRIFRSHFSFFKSFCGFLILYMSKTWLM